MRSLPGQDAVSSVVGTVLILAITVSTFGGVAFFVMNEVQNDGRAPLVDVQVVSSGERFVVKHRGGAALPVDEVTLHIYDGMQRHDVALASFPGIGPTWDIGESLVVADVFPGTPVGVAVVSAVGGRSTLLATGGDLSGGPGSGAGGSGGPSAAPQLRIAAVSSQPLVVGQPVTFDALQENVGGVAATANTVLFELLQDASVVWTSAAPAGGLAAGTSGTVTSEPWTASAGTYVLRVTADSLDVVAESDETDNVWQSASAFAPADGSDGATFLDADNDGLFTPGLDTQLEIMTLTSADCASHSCSAGDLGIIVPDPGDGTTPGLVVSEQAGTVTTSGSQRLYFAAPGDVEVHADLEGTGGDPIILRSTTGDVTLGGQSLTNGQGDILLEAAGDIHATGTEIETNGNLGTITLRAGGATTISGASLVANGNAGGIVLEAGADIVATGAMVKGKGITFTAPATASIAQEGLALLDRGGGPHPGATNTNATCVSGTLAQGAWSDAPLACAP